MEGLELVELEEIDEHPDIAMAGLDCTWCMTPAAATDMAAAIVYLNQHRLDVHGRPAGVAGGVSKNTETRDQKISSSSRKNGTNT